MTRFLVILCVVLGLASAAPSEAHTSPYQPCHTEDSTFCVWDGDHFGNGTGQSFWTGRDGKVWPIPHHVAHYMLGTG